MSHVTVIGDILEVTPEYIHWYAQKHSRSYLNVGEELVVIFATNTGVLARCIHPDKTLVKVFIPEKFLYEMIV